MRRLLDRFGWHSWDYTFNPEYDLHRTCKICGVRQQFTPNTDGFGIPDGWWE